MRRAGSAPDVAPQGPGDPETIVRQAVNRERQQARGPLEEMVEDRKGLPDYEEHLAQKWAELEARAADGPQQELAGPCQDNIKSK